MTHSTNYGDLLKRQAELQRLGRMRTPTQAEVELAVIVEAGEAGQEAKPDWAWWKKLGDKSEVNRPKLLEESADILHFLLLLDLLLIDTDDIGSYPVFNTELHAHNWTAANPTGLVEVVRAALNPAPSAAPRGLSAAIHLCQYLSHYGYIPEDLARAYWEKTEENLRRWAAVAEAEA